MNEPYSLPPSPPSPPSSSASDSDAFNTAEARLHFGPLRSPEKKYIATPTRANVLHPGIHTSPLRRSPRLSTPQPHETIHHFLYQEENGIPQSRTDTPDIERDLQDEPPSALAIKISRAHDNPSPPPGSPPVMILPDIASPSPHAPPTSLNDPLLILGSGSEIENLTRNLPLNTSPFLPRNLSPIPSTSSREPSQVDLVTFDSFSFPTRAARSTSPKTLSPKQFPLRKALSVDNLSSKIPEDGQKLLSEVVSPVESSLIGRRGDEDSVKLLPSSSSEGSSEDWPSSSSLDRPGHTKEKMQESALYAATLVEDGHDSCDSKNGLDEKEKLHPQYTAGQGDKVPVIEVWKDSQSPHALHYELDSLPLTSTNQHDSLVLSPLTQHPPSLVLPEHKTAIAETDGPLRSPVFSQQALPQTPMRPIYPIRFASSARPASQKPTGARLQPVDLDDHSRTPARRIHIAEAVNQGQISPLKGPRLIAGGSRSKASTVHQPTLNILPTDSPARRVGISEMAKSAAPQGLIAATPTRSLSKLRAGSVELPPHEGRDNNMQERPGSTPPPQMVKSSLLRTPVFGSSMTFSTSKPAILPFPIVASQKKPATSILEGDNHVESASPAKTIQATFLNPPKVTLKQTTSRIPRTVKPYGRPTPTLNGASNPTIINTRVDVAAKACETPKVVRKAGSSGEASRLHFNDVKSQDPVATTYNAVSSASSLKRKRVMPETSSPMKTRPVVLLRQVPRVVEITVPSTSQAATLPSITVHQEKKPLQQIRRVVDRPPNAHLAQVQVSESNHLLPSDQSRKPIESDPEEFEFDATDIQSTSDDKEAHQVEAILADGTPSPPNHQGDITAPHVGSARDGIRRTTRARKPINVPVTLNASNFNTRPVASRRRAAAQTSVRQDPTFLGMSATALRALTTSNTAKNQRYLAAKLETEVIRKEGQRPESPTVKVRTISQRKLDEKSKQRKERAAKRARRNSGGFQDQTDTGGCSDEDYDSESDLDDQNSSPAASRHKRGPGDEESYQTPLRKFKRLKLREDDEVESEMDERRVKWDRGLSTTIYLDQVKLGTRQPLRDSIAMKGCLALTAKTILLDSLGNLPHAESPLTELVEEHVVVKRFVYDNDVEPVQPIVVKNTRLRNKKGKS